MYVRIMTQVIVSFAALLWSGLACARARPTCDEWLQFSPAEQAVAMRDFIENAVPT